MKNKNEKTEGAPPWRGINFLASLRLGLGETRLVWMAGPERGGEAPKEHAVDLSSKALEAAAQREAAEAGEKPLDFEKLRNNPEALGQKVDDFAEIWERLGKSWDKLFAIFAPAGAKQSEIEASLHKPGASVEEPTEQEVKESEEEMRREAQPQAKETARDRACAKRADRTLKEHPDWMDLIKQASAKYEIPASTLATFIQMESGFNPRAYNKSSASGFAQVIKGTLSTYRRVSGNPKADPFDPATGIDIAAWVCRNTIDAVDRMVERGAAKGFKPEYKIGMYDVKKLYLAYNNGPAGYLVLQRYVDNPTPQNYEGLIWFQRRERDGWRDRYAYAERVEATAQVYRRLNPEADAEGIAV